VIARTKSASSYARGAGQDVDDALNATGMMFAQYLAQHASYRDQRLAFVGVGWTAVPPAPRSPLLMWTSNSMDSRGAWDTHVDAGFTAGTVGLLPDEPVLILVSGAGLSDEQADQLRLDLFGIVTATGDPEPVARCLIRHIRIAASTNPLIGSGLMVNCIPFACGRPGGEIMFIGGLPQSDMRTFTYVPAGQTTGPYLGPHVVGSGGERMQDFQALGQPGTFGFSYGQGRGDQPKSVVGQRVNMSDVGRNDPCWCGSGKKFKRCHGG
jgi:hypothetical protein